MPIAGASAAYKRVRIALDTPVTDVPLPFADNNQKLTAFTLLSCPAGSGLAFAFGPGGDKLTRDELIGRTADFTESGSQPPHNGNIYYSFDTAVPGGEAVVEISYYQACQMEGQ